MRKPALAALAVATAALAAVVVGPALPASAAPTSCSSSGSPYPVGVTQAQLQVSTTEPNRGEKFEVSGSHFLPNEEVKIYIGGTVTACQPKSLKDAILVGTGTTDSKGAFDPGVVVPDSLSGDQLVTGVGTSLKSFDFATTAITIGGSTPSSGSSTSGGGTPAHTGEDVALMLGAAALLFGGGVLLTRGGRRRRAASHN